MKKTLATLALAAGITIAGITPASAATGTVSVNCKGLTINLSKFKPGKNHIWITIDHRVAVDKDFGTSFKGKYPVPQDGASFDYLVTGYEAGTEDAQVYESERAGPCGSAIPKPKKHRKHKH